MSNRIEWSIFCLENLYYITIINFLRLVFSTVREVTKITFLPTTVRRGDKGVDGRYVTIGRDGTVTLWNKNLTLHKVMMVKIWCQKYKYRA